MLLKKPYYEVGGGIFVLPDLISLTLFSGCFCVDFQPRPTDSLSKSFLFPDESAVSPQP